MREAVFWREEAGEPPALPARELPARTDVVVVGAGITGLSAALTLGRLGASVTALETHVPGWGASSRNGGMTLTGLKEDLSTLIGRYGRERAHALFAASVECIAYLEHVVRREGIDCGFHRPGGLTAAYRPEHLQGLDREREVLSHELGYETQIIEKSDLVAELRTEYYHGGLLDPRSGALQPARYVDGLLQAALRQGAVILPRTPALAVQTRAGGFLVDTPRGRIACQAVLVATNAYTGDLHPGLRRRVIPLGSYIIATEPLGPQLSGTLLPRGRMIFDTKRVLFYFRRTYDDRILFGGRASFTPTDARRSATILRNGLAAVFPELAGARIDFSWSGSVAFTFDLLPHLGVLDGMHYAMGYCGHGVAMGTYLGHQAAQLAAGQPLESPFLGLHFPARFFYRRRPWFMPLAGGYFHLLDHLPL